MTDIRHLQVVKKLYTVKTKNFALCTPVYLYTLKHARLFVYIAYQALAEGNLDTSRSDTDNPSS